MNVKISPKQASSNEARWNYPGYPGDPDAPRGVKLQILTSGGISIHGQWAGTEQGHVAWAYLVQRNQAKEDWLKEHTNGR